MYTLDSRDFHDTLQNWSTATTFEIRAPCAKDRNMEWIQTSAALFFSSLYSIFRWILLYFPDERETLQKKKRKKLSLFHV